MKTIKIIPQLTFAYTILPDIFMSLVICITVLSAYAQPGTVISYQKISAIQGNFSGTLNLADHFSSSLTPIGDLDGDGCNRITRQ